MLMLFNFRTRDANRINNESADTYNDITIRANIVAFSEYIYSASYCFRLFCFPTSERRRIKITGVTRRRGKHDNRSRIIHDRSACSNRHR